MSPAQPEPSGTEAMAFQLVLAELHAHQEDLRALQQTVQQMLPLLAKMVGLLEAQGKQPEVPVATWDQMYAEAQAVPALPGEDAPAPQVSRAVPVPGPQVMWQRLWAALWLGVGLWTLSYPGFRYLVVPVGCWLVGHLLLVLWFFQESSSGTA
jgi:hypothetical protein